MPQVATDPGITGDLTEADIDLEWSGAVARNATIIFVKCDTKTNNGVVTSAQYAIDNNVAPVISISYGGCESLNGQAERACSFRTWYKKPMPKASRFLPRQEIAGRLGAIPPEMRPRPRA